MALPLKQRLFVSYYLGKDVGNATAAARRAGFSSPRQMATRLLSKASIREVVEARVAAVAMEADEVLARLSVQASSDMGDFLAPPGLDPSEPPPFDFAKARRRGQYANVKKVKRTTRTIPRRDEPPEVVVEVELQVYDPRPALETLAKFHGLTDGDARPADEKPRRIIVAGSDA